MVELRERESSQASQASSSLSLTQANVGWASFPCWFSEWRSSFMLDKQPQQEKKITAFIEVFCSVYVSVHN